MLKIVATQVIQPVQVKWINFLWPMATGACLTATGACLTFDQHRTLELFGRVTKNAKDQGFRLARFVTQMEWAVKNKEQIADLLEYEARANEAWERQGGPFHPVICTYDLTKFGGDVVVDVMRTHPMIIIGGILQENPFYVPPKKFLQELRERRGLRQKPTRE